MRNTRKRAVEPHVVSSERLKRAKRSSALVLGLTLTPEVAHALMTQERAFRLADLAAVRAKVVKCPGHWSGIYMF